MLGAPNAAAAAAIHQRLAEYSRHLAPSYADSFLAAAVQGFFENSGRQVVVCRVAGRDASTAALEIAGLRINARGPGAWAHRLWLKLGPGSAQDPHGTPTVFRLRIALFAPGVAPFNCFETPDPARMPQLIEDHDNFSLPPGSAPLPEQSFARGVGAHAGAAPQGNPCSQRRTGRVARMAPRCRPRTSRSVGAARERALSRRSRLYSPGADLATRRALISTAKRIVSVRGCSMRIAACPSSQRLNHVTTSGQRFAACLRPGFGAKYRQQQTREVRRRSCTWPVCTHGR